MIERFMSKVTKTDTCWLWNASCRRDGYGQFSVGGRAGTMRAAHRVSYEIHTGKVPDGLVIMHTCDVPRCVNPAHLVAGTQSENLADACRKGRRSPPKLSSAQARANAKAATNVRT